MGIYQTKRGLFLKNIFMPGEKNPPAALVYTVMNQIARSPSQTVEWLTCPVKRALNYSMGVRPRRLSKGDIAAIGGRAFAKGIETWNLTHDATQSILAAEGELAKNKGEIVTQGREVPDGEMSSFLSLDARVTTAVKKFTDDDPLPAHGLVIEDVELTLPDHGNARIDVGARDAGGNLVVVDYKFKTRLKAEYLALELEDYENHWQQFHYAWAYGEFKHEPVNAYWICLVIGEPRFDVKMVEYPVHPESLEAWKDSAERIWTQMEWEDRGVAKPWMAAVHRDRFGPCPYKKACFKHFWDMPLMMREDYVVVKED